MDRVALLLLSAFGNASSLSIINICALWCCSSGAVMCNDCPTTYPSIEAVTHPLLIGLRCVHKLHWFELEWMRTSRASSCASSQRVAEINACRWYMLSECLGLSWNYCNIGSQSADRMSWFPSKDTRVDSYNIKILYGSRNVYSASPGTGFT